MSPVCETSHTDIVGFGGFVDYAGGFMDWPEDDRTESTKPPPSVGVRGFVMEPGFGELVPG